MCSFYVKYMCSFLYVKHDYAIRRCKTRAEPGYFPKDLIYVRHKPKFSLGKRS